MSHFASHIKKPIQAFGLRQCSLGHDNETVILTDITLDLPLGHTAWLTGPSGSGKSTILKTLSGLINPMQGEVFINKEIVSNMTFEEFLPYRLNIGYSFELGGLLNNRTLWDNLMLPLLYHKAADLETCEKRVTELFDVFGLHRFRNERPSSVSGAIRKATCVARAFVLDPEVLLLDEPTTGLSEDGTKALKHLMLGREKRPLALITSRDEKFMQDISDAQLIADHKKNYLGFRLMKRTQRPAV